jgi:hypothetical protein
MTNRKAQALFHRSIVPARQTFYLLKLAAPATGAVNKTAGEEIPNQTPMETDCLPGTTAL